MRNYYKFAEVYDELMYDVDYFEWYKFIKRISNKKLGKVLEMACGTGNITEYLLKDESVKSILAFDKSEDMLSQASQKLYDYNNITFVKMNMEDINFINQKFDTVISACDSMNYLLDENDLKAVFLKVSNILEDRGKFIFDINSYYKLSIELGNNIFTDETDSIFYIWENYFDKNTEICDFYLTFFKKNYKGLYERFDEFHQERAYRISELKEYLREYFLEVKIYTDFSITPIEDNFDEKNINRVFFVCEK